MNCSELAPSMISLARASVDWGIAMPRKRPPGTGPSRSHDLDHMQPASRFVFHRRHFLSFKARCLRPKIPYETDDDSMQLKIDRRGALAAIGSGLIASGLGQNGPANAALEATLEPANAKSLRELSRELAGIRRRRDFNTVPMIREEPDSWDSMPLEALLAYKGGRSWRGTIPI
jgi:hypothetical protein